MKIVISESQYNRLIESNEGDTVEIKENDENLTRAIVAVLSRLITPKLGGDVDYQVEIGDHFVPNNKHVFIYVFINENNYWEVYNSGQYNNGEGYDSQSDFDKDIENDIRKTLRYLGKKKSLLIFFWNKFIYHYEDCHLREPV